MAAPEYKKIFNVKPDFKGGLASLLQGLNQGRQQGFANRNADRNAPVGDNELERMMLENYQKGLASQLAYAPMTGGQSISFPQFKSAILGLQQTLKPQNAGFDPSTGQPNPVMPVQQIQGMPGPSMPAGAAQPAAPIKVFRKVGKYSQVA